MREPLIAQYLKAAGLIKMFDPADIDDGRDYYLCARTDSELSQESENRKRWLRREGPMSAGSRRSTSSRLKTPFDRL